MMSFREDNFTSFDEFMSLSDCKLNTSLRDALKAAPIAGNKTLSTFKVKEETSSRNKNFVVPFARSSKTVQRSNSLHRFDKEKNESDHGLSNEKHRDQFSSENIARRERSGNSGIRVENIESKPFASGIFGSKVVSRTVRNKSPKRSTDIMISKNTSSSCSISVEDLPHPSKLRKRKRSSTSRQKRSIFEVDAHLALLKRKHAEFNWTPRGPTTTSNCSDTEDVLPQELMLQKVPNTSPPLTSKGHLSERTPLLYNESPQSWPKYHDSSTDSCFPPSITIQDQITPETEKGNHAGFDDCHNSDEDFHLNFGNVLNGLPNFINNSDNFLPTCWSVELQDSVKEE